MEGSGLQDIQRCSPKRDPLGDGREGKLCRKQVRVGATSSQGARSGRRASRSWHYKHSAGQRGAGGSARLDARRAGKRSRRLHATYHNAACRDCLLDSEEHPWVVGVRDGSDAAEDGQVHPVQRRDV